MPRPGTNLDVITSLACGAKSSDMRIQAGDCLERWQTTPPPKDNV
jgi:hypothetical protein